MFSLGWPKNGILRLRDTKESPLVEPLSPSHPLLLLPALPPPLLRALASLLLLLPPASRAPSPKCPIQSSLRKRRAPRQTMVSSLRQLPPPTQAHRHHQRRRSASTRTLGTKRKKRPVRFHHAFAWAPSHFCTLSDTFDSTDAKVDMSQVCSACQDLLFDLGRLMTRATSHRSNSRRRICMTRKKSTSRLS